MAAQHENAPLSRAFGGPAATYRTMEPLMCQYSRHGTNGKYIEKKVIQGPRHETLDGQIRQNMKSNYIGQLCENFMVKLGSPL